jgi:hypothetical protein
MRTKSGIFSERRGGREISGGSGNCEGNKIENGMERRWKECAGGDNEGVNNRIHAREERDLLL